MRKGPGRRTLSGALRRREPLLTSAPPRPISRALPGWAKGRPPALRVLLCTGASPRLGLGLRETGRGRAPLLHLRGYGPADCLPWANPSAPWKRSPARARLAMAMDFDQDDGARRAVCQAPFPSQPLGLIDDPTGDRLRATYFPDDPNTWRHGDYGYWTEKGVVLLGRADAVLNRGGVRMGGGVLRPPGSPAIPRRLPDCGSPGGRRPRAYSFCGPGSGVTSTQLSNRRSALPCAPRRAPG